MSRAPQIPQRQQPNKPQPQQFTQADQLFAQGMALHLQGQLVQAQALYEKVLKVQPKHFGAVHLSGVIAFQTKKHSLAVDLIAQAIEINPNIAAAYSNRGLALQELKQFDAAVASYDKAIAIKPDFAEAYSNRGNALKELKQFDAAVTSYDKAIAIKPDFAEAYSNRGNALKELKQFDAAVASYDKAIALEPDYADAYWNKSTALLARGEFAEGWKLYLQRPSVRNPALPLYRQMLGHDLAGIRMLLVKDQGLGDEIFFLRFAPELKRRGAHLTYRAGGKIATMLRRLSFLDMVIDEDALAPPSDIVISVGDLPFLLGMKTASDIPPSLCLQVLPDRLVTQRVALAALGPPPYIGVTWRAGTGQTGKLFKSAPLNEIGAVLRRTGGTLIGLQREPKPGELAALAVASGTPVHDFTGLNDRLEDMLALLALLDDYVAVSNTNVHLRAAVGRGSRVLAPSLPESRWMATGSVSPWFPECKVYRQEIGGSWDTALATLASDLAPSGAVQQGAMR